MKSFIAASRLRRWLNRSDAPPVIKECKAIFDRTFGRTFKESTIFEDTATSKRKPATTPLDLLPLVGESQVVLRAHASYAGVTYSRSSTHLGNSLILYRAGEDVAQQLSAGSIRYIYDNNGSVKLAVQRQTAVAPGTVDPFGPYPDYHARLYSTRLSEDLEEVQLSWVMGHYARWALSDDVCIVVPLLRVSWPHSQSPM